MPNYRAFLVMDVGSINSQRHNFLRREREGGETKRLHIVWSCSIHTYLGIGHGEIRNCKMFPHNLAEDV